MELAHLPSGEPVETLAQCEEVIERGLATFVEVGQALLRIRDARLYRETHATYEAYCSDRWGFTGRRANQLIAAAEVGTIVPAPSEGVAREMAGMRSSPDDLREAWGQVVQLHGPDPTASQVRESVRGVIDGMRSETRAFNSEHQPADFDPVENAEKIRLSGAFRRLTRDITASLGTPEEFAGRVYRSHVTEPFPDLARETIAWLEAFITEWEHPA